MARQYKIVFTVDNKRSETVITATISSDAKKILEMQYPGRKISVISCNEVK